MRSLTTHLTAPGGHGHLPFHPSCPICRTERLHGHPPADELLGQRPRALLAAAMLAGCTLAPTAGVLTTQAAAQEDNDDENTANDDDDPAHEDQDGDGGFDDNDDLPLNLDSTTDPPPQSPPAVVDTAPKHPATGPPPASTSPDPAPEPAAPAPGSTRPTTPTPTGDEKQKSEPDRDDSRGDSRAPKRPPATDRGGDPAGAPESFPPSPPAASPRSPTIAAAPQARVQAIPPNQPAAVESGQAERDEHVVRAGECLWSIARDQLGAGATPAAIARMVNRLWELNADRIATGDPDLIVTGTTLELP